MPVLIDIRHADHIEKTGDFYTASVDDFVLHSAFQPVISLAHHRIIGHEALVRPFRHGESLSPDRLFKTLGGNAFASELDRSCRTLHLMNASLANAGNDVPGWLFINIDANTILEDFYSAREIHDALDPLGFRPEHVVLEILEKNIEDTARLAMFVRHYRDTGFRIALDDFGIGESNFERIYTIRPDVVKLDRNMLHNLAPAYNGINILKSVVAMLREMGSLVLVEGVETEAQAMMVMETDADLVQGYYFGKPVIGAPPRDAGDVKRQLRKLSLLQRNAARKRIDFHHELDKPLREAFAQALAAANAQGDEVLAEYLFRNDIARSFYWLDHQGTQVSPTFHNFTRHREPRRYHPLEAGEGVSRARRDYFVEAMLKPGSIFVSSPYLALPESLLTVTASSTFRDKNGQLRILCLDTDVSPATETAADGKNCARIG